MAASATCAWHADPALGGPTGGTLVLDGIPPGAQVQSALLYWSVISDLAPVPTGAPELDGVPLTVVPLGEVPTTPCFDRSHARTGTFRADVTRIVTGNGTYRLGGLEHVDDVTFTEGATLLAVFCAAGEPTRHVIVWDGVDVSRGDAPVSVFRQSLDGLQAPAAEPVVAELLVVAGNGQGREPLDSDVDPLLFQGVDLDAREPSLLSGALCPPLGLYDLTRVDVTGLIPSGADVATIEIQGPDDCHSVAAVVLAIEEPGGGGGPAEPSPLDVRPSAEPLRVRKLPPSSLRLTWEATGGLYDAHAGAIGGWYDHAPLGCGLGSATLDVPMSGLLKGQYFLAVATGCGGESSYGRDSFGRERPTSLAASGTGCR